MPIAAVILSCVIGAAAQPLEETVIAGESLSEWRARMSALDPEDPASAQWVSGLIAIIESERVPWFTRRQAALTLGRMRHAARDAVPVLRRRLGEIGDDPETGPQLWALKALSLFGPVARDAAPDIARLVQSPAAPSLARLTAVDALSQIGPAHPVAIPTLIALGGDPSEPVLRRAAIEALGMNGPAATSALPVLVRALDDSDENLRREAAVSLGKLGPIAEPSIASLLERMVLDEIPAVQDAAATALAAMGPAAGSQLVPLLESDDAETRLRVVRILGSWKTKARNWQTAIEACWKDSSPAVRLASLEASWHMTGQGDVVAPLIAAEIAEDDRQQRIAAVRLLDRLGADATAAKPVLVSLLNHDRSDVRLAATKALSNLPQ